MSFTVIHHKNGREIPIKMSIWDAFSGVPNPRPKKPRVTNCPCCGKVHKGNSDAKKSDDQKGGNKNNAKDGDANGKGNTHSTSETETYSKEDDTIIVKMKGEGKEWKEILAAINKTSKTQLTEHYKKNLKNGGESNQSQPKKDEKGDNDGKGGKKGSQGGNNKNSKADQNESNLKAWAAGYDNKKWVALASKHYDVTGQRISPEAARKLAEKK